MWFPVILALLATLSLILSCAAVLGVIVRRVYAPAHETAVREATVLEYAAPERGLARLRRHIWLGGLLACLPLIALIPIPALLIWAQFGVEVSGAGWAERIFGFESDSLILAELPQLMWALWVATGSAAVGTLIIIARGLYRRADGMPAAAAWRSGRLWSIAGLVLLTAFALCMIEDHRIAAEGDARLARLNAILDTPPSGACPDSADLYAAAGRAHEAYLGSPAPVRGEHYHQPSYPEPKPVPLELVEVVSLLHRATAAEVVDLGGDPRVDAGRELLAKTLRLRGLFQLLEWHALDAARGGDWTAFHQSLTAMKQMTRHIADGIYSIRVAVALNCARDMHQVIEQALPFVDDEEQIAELELLPAEWFSAVALRAYQLDQAWMSRQTWAALNGHAPDDVPTWRERLASSPLRLLLARREFHDEDALFAEQFEMARRMQVPANWRPPASTGSFFTTSPGATAIFTTFAIEGQTQRTLVSLGLAATKYRLRTGALPKGFNELLSAGLIESIPEDPWDGRPMKLIANDAEVVFYSIGRDRVDDNGGVTGKDMAQTRDNWFRVSRRPLWELYPPKE